MPVVEDGTNLKDSGTFRSTYQLDPNSVAGFETAVRNGQTRLALEYAVSVIGALREDLDALRNEVAQLKVPAAKAAAAAPKKKEAEPKDATSST